MKLNFKERKGITLIALVITIVILLILAGITISSLTGENGLITRAKEAKEKTEYSQALEELNLKIMDVQTIKGREATLQDIVEALKDDEQYTYIVNLKKTAFLSNEGEIVLDSDITGKITNDVTSIRVIHKEYEFEINNNLKVSYIGSKGVHQKKECTISLDANGGTITENEIKIMNGDLYGDLPEPTRENCNFEGWYTSKKVSEGTKIEATDEFSLKEDQTLYAIWSHTHTAASGATLVSGTALGNDGAYSLSGGCYTTSNSYSAACGSTSYSIISVSGQEQNHDSCGSCGLSGGTSGPIKLGGTFLVRCNSCSNYRSKSASGWYWCSNSYMVISSTSNKVASHGNISIIQAIGLNYCTTNVTKTRYIKSCGLSSGLLDQE